MNNFGNYHLEGSEVFLPPQVFPHVRAHRSEHVVRVHDDVHEGIQQPEERGVSARGELHAEPDGHWHYTVVDHMQRRHVVKLLSEYKEDLRTKITFDINKIISLLFYKHIG